MSESELVVSDRYSALGIVPNGCTAQCEGTGVVPIYMSEGDKRQRRPDDIVMADETDPAWIAAWRAAEAEAPATNGWHFVKCPACSGT